MTYQRKLLNRKSKTTAVNQLKINEQVVSGKENIIANVCKVFFCEIGPKLAETIPTNKVRCS